MSSKRPLRAVHWGTGDAGGVRGGDDSESVLGARPDAGLRSIEINVVDT